MDWENVKILEIENNYYKRMIREMIHIKEQTNGINCIKDIEMLDGSYSDILKELLNNKILLILTYIIVYEVHLYAYIIVISVHS